MFGIGIQELLLILAVALLVVGPTKLPGVARSLGKGLKELRKVSDDLRGALMFDDDDDAPKRRYAEPPRGADAPLVSANAAPGIHGSLAAGAATMGEGTNDDDDEPRAVPADDGVISRGESGGDPHKRALDAVPADAEVSALLDDTRRSARDAGVTESARGTDEKKDATS